MKPMTKKLAAAALAGLFAIGTAANAAPTSTTSPSSITGEKEKCSGKDGCNAKKKEGDKEKCSGKDGCDGKKKEGTSIL